ncbi:unnamed protein product [Rotaria sp. Silwood1]|nr:unnamed protein product [Rotaria sp. Silwood1]
MMTTAQNSNFANEDMNKLLSVSVRTTNHRSRNNLLATMRVKSHGTIVCMRNRFLDFQVSDNRYHQADFIRIPPDASVMTVVEHLTQVWFPKVGCSNFL